MSSVLRSTKQKLTQTLVATSLTNVFSETTIVSTVFSATNTLELSAMPAQLGNTIVLANSGDVTKFLNAEFALEETADHETLVDLGAELVVKSADANGVLVRFRSVERPDGSSGLVVVENRTTGAAGDLAVTVARV